MGQEPSTLFSKEKHLFGTGIAALTLSLSLRRGYMLKDNVLIFLPMPLIAASPPSPRGEGRDEGHTPTQQTSMPKKIPKPYHHGAKEIRRRMVTLRFG